VVGLRPSTVSTLAGTARRCRIFLSMRWKTPTVRGVWIVEERPPLREGKVFVD
jgi:hypothetical protein